MVAFFVVMVASDLVREERQRVLLVLERSPHRDAHHAMWTHPSGQQLYRMARAAGLNKEDGLAVVKVLERLAGVEVKAR